MSRTKVEYANNEVGLGVAPALNLQTLAADAYTAVEPFLEDTSNLMVTSTLSWLFVVDKAPR